MAENDVSSSVHEGLLDMDEALEVLDRNGADVCRQQQKQAKRDIECSANYTRSFREYREKVMPSEKKRRGVKKQKLPATMSHSAARLYTPGGCSIWRDLTRGLGAAIAPPPSPDGGYHAVGSSMGEHGAMVNVLPRLWRQFLDMHGLPDSACPGEELEASDPSSGVQSSSVAV